MENLFRLSLGSGRESAQYQSTYKAPLIKKYQFIGGSMFIMFKCNIFH